MVALPLLSGVNAKGPEWIDRHPLNLEPIPVASGISKGQLRAAQGATAYATGPGIDRGGIVWNNAHIRVMGTKLVQVGPDASVTTLGDVGGSGPVTLDYGFDRLAIRSGTSLYYWNGATLTQVTDIDLGTVLDMIWIEGYYMTTDGQYVPVTELSDPTSVMPLKYGSAEADPDPITGLLKNRQTGEAIVLGRYTIQTLQNQGGAGFPFAAVAGATLPVGCVSASAKCYMGSGFAFVGSGREDGLGVYLASSQNLIKISDRALDDLLAAVEDPTAIELERRASRDEQRLIVHLPTESWCYLVNATQTAGEPLWYRLRSGVGKPYRLRNAVLAYGKWIVGDTETATLGQLSDDTDAHFGEAVEWEFGPGLIYNSGKPAIAHEFELIGLPGRGSAPGSFFLSMTKDGETFSPERPIIVAPGERRKRLLWRPHTRFQTFLGLKFRGIGGQPGFSALEAAVQPL
jgi:hypothetical protein